MVKRVIILLMMAIFVISAFADDTVFSTLKCIIKTYTGALTINEKVVITSGKNIYTFTTDAKGSLIAMVPIGDISINALGVTKSVKILTDTITECEIIGNRPGIIVNINNMETDANYSFKGAYILDAKEFDINDYEKISDNNLYFNVPKDATSFEITGILLKGKIALPKNSFHKAWTFDSKESCRNLSIQYPFPVSLSLKVFDKTGKAIEDGTRIRGKVIWNISNNNRFIDWTKDGLKDDKNLAGNDCLWINNTVIGGILQIPYCMPGSSYTLQLSTENNQNGAPVRFIIDENGKANIDSYNFIPRNITMVAFDYSGMPAINEKINASYIDNGKIKLLSLVSDNKGIVVLHDILPVRVTVWGDNIPTGIIPAYAVNITTPLELPAFNTYINSSRVHFQLPVKTSSGVCAFKLNDRYQYDFIPINSLTTSDTLNGCTELYSNTLIYAFITINEDIPRSKAMKFCIPFNDSPSISGGLYSTLEINDFDNIPSVNINILNPDGKSPAQINSLTLTSDEIPDDIMRNNSCKIIKIRKTDSGIYLQSLLPGKYKIYIDMMSDLSEPVAEVSLPSNETKTIIMKNEPLKLPGGSIVCWGDYNNPLKTHSMLLPADKLETPVYYDKNKPVTWWCKTSPTKMLISNENKIKELTLKTYSLKYLDVNNKEITSNDYTYLNSLFPMARNYQYQTDNILPPFYINANTEVNIIQLYSGTRVSLWNTRYLIKSNDIGYYPELLEINDNTPSELIIHKSTSNSVQTNKDNKYIYIDNGNTNYKNGKNLDMMIIPNNDKNKFKMLYRSENCLLDFPDNTENITVICPSIGIAKNIPYKFVDNYIRLKKNDFSPLTTVKGKLYDSQGHVMKNTPINIAYAGLPAIWLSVVMYGNTDAEGNYKFENIPEGTFLLYTSTSSMNNIKSKPSLWLISVPEGKNECIIDLKLIDDSQIKQLNNIGTDYYINNSVNAYAWFLPDNSEKALQIPFLNSTICVDDYKSKSGTLYAFSTNNGRQYRIIYKHITFSDNFYNMLNDPNTNLKLPTISLTAPLISNYKYPNNIIINGVGPWKDIKYSVYVEWSLYSGINSAITQLVCLPPGDWILKVNTNSGETIEQNIHVNSNDMSVKINLK